MTVFTYADFKRCFASAFLTGDNFNSGPNIGGWSLTCNNANAINPLNESSAAIANILISRELLKILSNQAI